MTASLDTNFETTAPIQMTVGDMLAISIALTEAAKWNRIEGYPHSANGYVELRERLRAQFKPYFDVIDDRAAGIVRERQGLAQVLDDIDTTGDDCDV